MKRLLAALAVPCLALCTLHAQEPPPPPPEDGTAPQEVPEPDGKNAPKIREAVDLSESEPAEAMEIPVPPDAPDPAKSEEVTEPLPGDEKAPTPPPVTGKIEVTAADAGKVIRAVVGNLIVITLKSDPGAGYNWELHNFDYGAADFYSSETVPVGEGNVLVGAPAKTVLALQAVQPGTQDIKLAYRRLWEPPDQVADTFAFRLEVAGQEPPTAAPEASPSATPPALPSDTPAS